MANNRRLSIICKYWQYVCMWKEKKNSISNGFSISADDSSTSATPRNEHSLNPATIFKGCRFHKTRKEKKSKKNNFSSNFLSTCSLRQRLEKRLNCNLVSFFFYYYYVVPRHDIGKLAQRILNSRMFTK